MGRTSGFSALTICEGTRKLIVYNPRHPPTRRANSVVHEVSHVVLEHPPAPALGEGGCRYWDSRLEGEADWQAAALLVPRDGAFAWLQAGNGLSDGANNFGVSLALFRWRVNHTGVAKQLAALGIRLN
jgi:Zn-dependent peptidase ImmA (M78 family)